MTQPTPARVRPHPLSVTNAERKMMKISPEKVSPNNKMDPLTPSKHSQFECSVSTESPTRQRARTVLVLEYFGIRRLTLNHKNLIPC